MDYSPFFNAAHQHPYHLLGLHSSTATPHPDELRDSALTLTPTFDYINYASAFNTNNNSGSFLPPSTDGIHAAAAAPPPPPPPPPSRPSPPRNNSTSSHSQHSRSHSNSIHQSIDMVRDDLAQYIFSDFIEEPLADKRSGRSSSEEKDAITPAQSRRKAQNRAAQRAFRERKERHVRDLEQKLTDLQAQSMTLHADNERLKRELAKIVTENEILRATSISGITGSSGDGDSNNNESSPFQAEQEDNDTNTTGPPKFLPTDMRKNLANGHKTGSLPHRIVRSSDTGERLLNARAAWDYIQAHPLYKQGLIDIGDVCERLKSLTQCDGQGPVFEEACVRKAIEESVASGNDELI